MSRRYGEITCPLLLLTSPQDHVVEPAQRRLPGRDARRPGRADQPRAQLPRRHARLRQGPDLRGRGRLRPQGDGLSVAGAPCSTAVARPPSPARRAGTIKLGPLQLRAYGLMIALGVLAAVWLAGRRLEARGVGTREDMSYDRAVGGARRGHRLPAVPRRSRTGGASRVTGSTPSRSGRAASASGAASASAWSSGSGPRMRRGIPLQGGLVGHHAGAAAGPGHRPVGQLVEPGAVRPADRPAVGARGLARQGRRRGLPARHDVPPDVPLRVAVVPAACAAR